MKKGILFAFVALLSTGLFAQTTWTVDKAHSQVSFGITHMGIAEVTGLFRSFDASINTTNGLDNATYNVTIDVNSVDTGVERRDNHLRSDDFFAVEKHPELTFKSKSVKKDGENRYKVTGDLSLHGITKPVTLDVWHRGTITKDDGTQVAGFQITGEVSRQEFNIGPDFPEAALSDDVRIKVDAEFKK
ncbi:YceI family protein [Antarcticibacterium flavum]|uniref:YceI family protein n=1 Tax=Antarcticibacterium flavum TaxID=2058175 RepID=A0A5B7WZ45_9FLAO|nr:MULTISPECIES: YceI family protein [Antarcticibacterium]MCM4161237.1 polyisoprenoid-binding protein [Antarcticibacterium sp. W02-3]QCY68446.1 YceI family protein [Antarcticibacterium flavum]